MLSRSESFQPRQLGFEQLAVLAVSRMATVELCRITEGEPLGAIVAVKRLPFDLVEDPQLRAMFRDEIWMASALRHPNVTRVLTWGEDESGPFLVVEFVRGVSLSRLMRTVFTTGEAFTERLIVFLATAVCGGLAAAHSLRADDGEFLNLVHREVTPGNILMGFDGGVKIADFGLAKAKQRVTQTAIGVTKGEPAYMSPEQVCGQQLDGRSDIFALGVLLYELFAQRRPWTVTNVGQALAYIVEGEAPDLGLACPHIDPALIELVNRCLAKKKEERFQSATEVKARLDRWLHLHGYTDSSNHLARFVRRNALRQMRWVDRVLAGEPVDVGPSPFELSNEVPASPKDDESMTRAEMAPSRGSASRGRASQSGLSAGGGGAGSASPAASPRVAASRGAPSGASEGSSAPRSALSAGSPLAVALSDVSPSDVSPSDVSPSVVSPSDVSPTDVSPTDVSPSVVSPSIVSPSGRAADGGGSEHAGSDGGVRAGSSSPGGGSRTRAESYSSMAFQSHIDAADTSISRLGDTQATKTRRHRAPTITVTNVPAPAADEVPPTGPTAAHSVLDLRTEEEGALIAPPSPPPSPRARGAQRQRAVTAPSAMPRGQSLFELREAASHITRAAAKLADQAEAAAANARRAADHAEMAAGSAKDMARRADRAAKAARLAGEAMGKMADGDDLGAEETLTKARRLHDADGSS